MGLTKPHRSTLSHQALSLFAVCPLLPINCGYMNDSSCSLNLVTSDLLLCFFADDVVLLVMTFGTDGLGQIAAECEAAGMTVRTNHL